MKASPMRKLSSPQENATMNIQMILWIQFSPSTKYRIPWIVDSFKIKQTEIRCRFSLSKKNCSSPGDTSLYSPGSCRPLMIWINWVEQSTVTVRSFTLISHIKCRINTFQMIVTSLCTQLSSSGHNYIIHDTAVCRLYRLCNKCNFR